MRKAGVLSEVIFWLQVHKGMFWKIDFDRQRIIGNYIVDFYAPSSKFVTPDLDEGPIIEQDVAHVSHTSTPEDLIALGRDIERRVLAKAVRLYAQDRIFIVGQRTVVFS